MVRGPQQWINDMIEENDYVLIPWFCQIDNQLPIKGKSCWCELPVPRFANALEVVRIYVTNCIYAPPSLGHTYQYAHSKQFSVVKIEIVT